MILPLLFNKNSMATLCVLAEGRAEGRGMCHYIPYGYCEFCVLVRLIYKKK